MKDIIPVIVALIENSEERMLLLKRSPNSNWAPNLWNIVTGKIEEGEGPVEAALREIREEVALPVSLQEEYARYDVDYDGKVWRTYAFRFSTDHADPILNDEHVDFAWVMPHELSSFDIVPVLLEDLRQMRYGAA
ncbi:MAG: NUDIX domain-containing protein [Candidatus Terrybacteria bacterium]|nr:NUDIX domain-containing protein [Candidatus Terrybacteria bacterium]